MGIPIMQQEHESCSPPTIMLQYIYTFTQKHRDSSSIPFNSILIPEGKFSET